MFVSSKGSRGTGLGLPVSQKILREHGGQIRLESEPGYGSLFIVEFPTNLELPAAESPQVKEQNFYATHTPSHKPQNQASS